MKSKRGIILLIGCVAAALASILVLKCEGVEREYQPIPKPHGYMRVDLPMADYYLVGKLPVNFELNALAKDTIPVGAVGSDAKWLDIVYPQFNATIHCSYIGVDASSFYYRLDNRIERVMMNANFQPPEMVDVVSIADSRVKSTLFINRLGGVTPVEFIATDSVSFLLSGTLAIYNNGEVESDSITPMIKYIESDIVHLLKTIKCHL